MGATQGDSQTSKHAKAVACSLGEADEAACRGEYADALAWLETLRAIGDELPGEYEIKQTEWLALLRDGRESSAISPLD